MRRVAAGTPLVGLLLVLTAGCGAHGSDGSAADPDSGQAAADADTCVSDARAVEATPAGFPASFPLPPGTVVYHVEDRGADGVIATGITATAFDHVLDAMNAAAGAGFRVTSGETEEDDAEADWRGHGFVGRWAIKKSATCPGETVVQVLAKRS